MLENNNNQNEKIESNKFIEKISIKIATSEDIENWSSGEVTKPETINYKTYKPEKNGLFDEIIFGPIKDYRCPLCGKKNKRTDAGKKCISCGKTTIESKMIRRRRMGHIKLATPVSHIWFSKVDYSIIRSILNLKQDELDSVLYYKSHIIYDNGSFENVKKLKIIYVNDAPVIYKDILKKIYKQASDLKDKKDIQEKIKDLEEDSMSSIGQSYGIDFYEYNEFIEAYSDIKIGTGSEVIKTILEKINLKKELEIVLEQIQNNNTKNITLRKNKILESFKNSGQRPESMITDIIPVIPADLRPLIQLEGGRHSTVDVNELYRRVIIRNNRLKQWLEIGAPNLIVQNEKRMLKEAVDALFDNSRKKKPFSSKDNRPLKSLAENLKGKQGRFRQNLLGKRVDYSGRSVIVVGPELKLHQVGLPKQMIVKLFEPFIVNLLVKENVANNIRQAKKMIEVFDDKIWKYASRVIKNHPVFLNRAPTLHRLSIQAFEPLITSGKAIRLHPLVTPSFNADFDGDQMAVHLPLSKKSKKEAWELMVSNKNILGPKDGKLILSPSQDIVLGLYYLTMTKFDSKGSKRVYKDIEEIKNLLHNKKIDLNAVVGIPINKFKNKFVNKELLKENKYLITTVGRILLNEILPNDFYYLNEIDFDFKKGSNLKYLVKNSYELKEKFDYLEKEFSPFKKNDVAKIIEKVFEEKREFISSTMDNIKDLGFKYSMLSGVSVGWQDILDLKKKDSMIKKGDEEVSELNSKKEFGFITEDQRYQQVLRVWNSVKEDVKEELDLKLKENKNNSLYIMMNSGARGNISNFVQLAGMRGSMSKASHEYAVLRRMNIISRNIEEIPVKSSFKEGLSDFEYFLSTHGARKGLSDTATKTAESGYLTRRLVDAVQNSKIIEEDCYTNEGIDVSHIKDTRTNSIIENIYDRLLGRFSLEDVKLEGKIILRKGELITEEIAKNISENDIKKVKIRSILKCHSIEGICKKCYGIDLSTNEEVNIGEAVGIIAAQSIGEPGTQLTMRTFHTGGVAGVSDITQGFSRLMELVDANKNPKSSAIIAKEDSIVESITPYENLKSKREKNDHYVVTAVNEKHKNKIEYLISPNQILRVGKGKKVKAGDKITEGSIRLQDLLEYAGSSKTESYLIKEIQRLYRIQGIEINDKHIELIVKRMLSKFRVIFPGDSKFFTSQIISENQLYEENTRLLKENKKTALVERIILGVKALPLYSESFLSAASYQRTAESLVNASISGKVDHLLGLKESLIVGNKIPVGTGMKTREGKYDIFKEEIYDENGSLNQKNLLETLNDNIVEF